MKRGLSIALPEEDVARGWEAFRFVEHALRRRDLTADEIEWRWCDESWPGIIRAVFEVLSAPPRSTGDVP